MKGIKTIFLALMVLVAFGACADENPTVPEDPEVPEVVEEGPDYLVMLYSVGGKSLDVPILSNIYQALDAGSSKNVKMTVQFKSSLIASQTISSTLLKTILKYHSVSYMRACLIKLQIHTHSCITMTNTVV